jgi:hypothetical protein
MKKITKVAIASGVSILITGGSLVCIPIASMPVVFFLGAGIFVVSWAVCYMVCCVCDKNNHTIENNHNENENKIENIKNNISNNDTFKDLPELKYKIDKHCLNLDILKDSIEKLKNQNIQPIKTIDSLCKLNCEEVKINRMKSKLTHLLNILDRAEKIPDDPQYTSFQIYNIGALKAIKYHLDNSDREKIFEIMKNIMRIQSNIKNLKQNSTQNDQNNNESEDDELERIYNEYEIDTKKYKEDIIIDKYYID